MDEHSETIIQYFDSFTDAPYGTELAAGLVFFLFLVLRSLFTKIVMGFAKNLAERTETTIDDELILSIENPIRFVFIVFGLTFSLRILALPKDWQSLIEPFIAGLYIYTLFWALFCAIQPIARALFTIGNKIGREINEDLQHFFIRTMEVIILMIGAVAILEQWDINISAFLGGLGLAGMAVALAAKDTVANLFGTLMIFTDRTFQKGDWIQTPEVEGTVEVIGLRASKIRTFAKALVSVPNAGLANSPITNWSRMTNRRIKMTLGLEYRTTAKQLENIVDRMRDFIQNDENVEPKGPVAQMVHLTEFANSSININLYYFTRTTNWEEWRQIQSDHIIAFKKIVEDEGASFAFPSTSLYVEQMPDQAEVMS